MFEHRQFMMRLEIAELEEALGYLVNFGPMDQVEWKRFVIETTN